MEMVSRSYASSVPRLLRDGKLSIAAVDEAVRRVLRVKLRAGLFEAPYADPARERATLLKPEFRAASREIAARSMVLLKNDGGVLPLAPSVSRLAVIGALADDRAEMMGNWTGDGRAADVVTLLAGIRSAVSAATRVTYARGVTVDLKVLGDPAAYEAADRAGIEEAAGAAGAADAVVLVLGETGAMSGEASSRASLDLPGRQLELAQRVIAAGRPTAVVLMNGRPLSIPWLAEHAGAILEAWFPGTEGGNAVADVLFGRFNPGGKLPATFPRTVGQVPIYYNHANTGRPPDPSNKYTSKYLDAPWTPLYVFGHGLSYTRFRLSNLRVEPARVRPDGHAEVSVDVENVGARPGDEVAQLYVRDLVASVSRPVQELEGFERITLGPGERKTVRFALGSDQLGFLDREMKRVVEPGTFRVRVGTSSEDGLEAALEVVGN
jgi:beta-glucosidase